MSPAALVERLVAVQSQDFATAKWSLGQRLHGVDEADVDRAFDSGEILRTHVLRPTWHFVSPADIRWLLELTAPRIRARNAPRFRQLGLDAKTLNRTVKVITRALEAEGPLPRDGLRRAVLNARISLEDPQRMAHILMNAELDAAICSGPRAGKQMTYALLDHRAPSSRVRPREEALAELAERFFATRAPATAHDFGKWSGLSVGDARHALEMATGLTETTLDGRKLWTPRGTPRPSRSAPPAHLLSLWDEYLSSYRDRDDIIAPDHAGRVLGQGAAIQWVLVLDGQVVGTWRRTIERGRVLVEVTALTRLSAGDLQAVEVAAKRYARFLGLESRLSFPAAQ